jgi:two-component system, chemotaxis family, sensor kinase CheA
MSKMNALKRFFGPVTLLVLVFLLASSALFWVTQNNRGYLDQNGLNVQVAGRARLEWQRVMRYLHTLRFADSLNTEGADSSAANAAREEAIKNLRASTKLLDDATQAFVEGGTVDLGVAGSASIQAGSIPRGAQEAAQQLFAEWNDFATSLKPALAGTRASTGVVRTAFDYALQKDAAISQALSAVVGQISFSSFDAANRLSRLLYIASALAALFIGFLIWLFSRQLKKVNAAREQMTEILSTVPSGLMLIDKNFKISDQYSSQLETMFGQRELGGKDFFSLFERLSDVDTLSTARDFMTLLFGDQVDENLIHDVNPLDQVTAMVPNASGRQEKRTLGFGFKRVMSAGKLSHLLVTVSDITTEMQLKEQVQKLEKQSDQNMSQTLELLTSALSVDRSVLDDRLTRYRQLLDEANEKLKSAGRGESAYRMLIDDVFRPVHTLKGETAALNLRVLSTAASEAEHELAQLRGKSDLNGNDFLALTIRLDELYDRLNKLKLLANKLTSSTPSIASSAHEAKANTAPAALPANATVALDVIRQSIAHTAQTLGKKAVFQSAGLDKIALPSALRQTMTDILVQLSRNALAHGIEQPAQRVAAGKAELGKIQAQLQAHADAYELLFRDDGAGLDFSIIRERAVALGKLSAEQAASADPRQLAGLIFEPGFSTASGRSDAAGHGVGLDVVMAAIKRIGGKIAVGTQPGQYTQFRIRFPLSA